MKIYCINLERRKDRKEKMKNQLNSVNIPFEFIEAIDYKDLDRVSYYLKGYGEHACLLSHIKTLEKLKEDNENIGIILEDDVMLTTDFEEKLENFLKKVPQDWVILYLGFIPMGEYSEGIIKMRGDLGAHAYCVRGGFIDELIEDYKTMVRSTDVVLASHQHVKSCYGIIPMLAIQNEDYSDIQEKKVKWEEMQKYF